MPNTNRYSLALMRGDNNFLPIDWRQLREELSHADLYSLDNIDQFTSGLTKEELINELLSRNFINDKEEKCPIVIIFYENEGNRILQEGPCFIEDKDFLDKKNIKDYIKDNIDNRQLINKIYNYIKNTLDVHMLSFANLLNSSGEILKSKGEIGYLAIEELIDTYITPLDYPNLRKIGMYISKNLVKKEKKKKYTYTIKGVVDEIWITKDSN